ncbi:hypothetical protein [Tautonia plasticadhaerens]|uniref:Uncharacterized protein n=1 Tax=Tautonia plasticadhaerens TaxID=2527974 RepID=A0A518H4B9_9BACT|nr:hypothetical protein [Tautonia plasticadhaerens]QDV35676.1 hypothetical protein ElP_35800 [Tautonia plasticadhaerens]
MQPSELVAYFCKMIPQKYPDHMFCYFSANAAKGNIKPFVFGLIQALGTIEDASPEYAFSMIDRMASMPGAGEKQYEALLQILCEIYVTAGAVEAADRTGDGKILFAHEPGQKGKKNPEFESCANEVWYAVEVKTPELIAYSRQRQSKSYQFTARVPVTTDFRDSIETTNPRDNPVKDFLISANEKLQAYAQFRSDAFRILTLVWDDFCQEPIAALLNPLSGLFTDRSFCKAKDGKPTTFPFVDAVEICRCQHQIIRSTREESMIDGELLPFVYHHQGYPPKVLIDNPIGRRIPDILLAPLNVERLSPVMGAEYHPTDYIIWLSGRNSDKQQ